MNTTASILNYVLFLILYITCFTFFYIKNTEIIGFYLLFIVNTACILNNFYYFGNFELNLIPKAIMLSLIISGTLHTVSLIFIIIMISNLRVKYQNTFGTPINLPPIYKNRLEEFKGLMVFTFGICSLLLIIFMFYLDSINFVFNDQVKTIGGMINNKFSIILLGLTTIPVIISCIQLKSANSFSIIARQKLIK